MSDNQYHFGKVCNLLAEIRDELREANQIKMAAFGWTEEDKPWAVEAYPHKGTGETND